ncbi:MAG: hypothetical protein B7X33_04815, partial [Lysobacterales bacterium 13-68-4]
MCTTDCKRMSCVTFVLTCAAHVHVRSLPRGPGTRCRRPAPHPHPQHAEPAGARAAGRRTADGVDRGRAVQRR